MPVILIRCFRLDHLGFADDLPLFELLLHTAHLPHLGHFGTFEDRGVIQQLLGGHTRTSSPDHESLPFVLPGVAFLVRSLG